MAARWLRPIWNSSGIWPARTHASAHLSQEVHLFGSTKRGFAADRHLKVADIALDVHHLAVGQHLDVGVGYHPLHLGDDQRPGVLHAGEGLVELGHAPAQAGLPFDEIGLVAGVGNVQRSFQPGDAAADDQGRRGDVHLSLLQRFQQRRLGHRAGDQLLGLLRAGLPVGVNPGHLLADVGHLEIVGVDAHLLDGGAKGGLVHPRRAGGDDDPVQVMVADVLLDHLLAGVGAHVHIVAGDDHVGQRRRVFGHRQHVDRRSDVDPAMAYVHADSGCHSASSSTRSVRVFANLSGLVSLTSPAPPTP